VREWHAWGVEELGETLPSIVKRTLTATVTRNLPPMWQGEYTLQRASNWIEELDREATPLLVVDSSLSMAIGLVILFEVEQDANDSHLRLGYLLSEASWGKGYATELIAGFVTWCKEHDVATVMAGVESQNRASILVLEKNGFTLVKDMEESEELTFVLDLT
jgi:RimJ/RimL family protein N-acetyltransferase